MVQMQLGPGRFTVQGAASMLQTTEGTVRDLVRRKRLMAQRQNGRLFFTPEAIAAYDQLRAGWRR